MDFADINPLTTRSVAKACDGDSIMPPEWLQDYGVPEPLADYCVKEYRSDYDNYAMTIFDEDGTPVDVMDGVWTLDLLFKIAEDLGEWEIVNSALSLAGRGGQARVLKHGIMRNLNDIFLFEGG
tara:strand:- start:30 stop:401 length:372 start_codon:yes stop_codon:yes gene_type:complete